MIAMHLIHILFKFYYVIHQLTLDRLIKFCYKTRYRWAFQQLMVYLFCKGNVFLKMTIGMETPDRYR